MKKVITTITAMAVAVISFAQVPGIIGRHPANFLFGGPVLPNVLGVRMIRKD